MGTAREERLAKNEVLFRTGNERMAQWEERQEEPEKKDLYLCECASLGCAQKVALTLEEYEHVRKDACLFVLVDGHEVPDVEKVVEDHGEWIVVRKEEEVREIVTRAEPRGADPAERA